MNSFSRINFAKKFLRLFFINCQLAYLKENTSFDFIFENKLFTGSDSYTLSITFPLKGCPENIAIFGHIHRQDVEKNDIVFDCEISDRDFSRFGSIVITEINESEVKTQFLEGRSEQNFNASFDDIFLNALSLGYPSAVIASDSHIPDDWRPYPDNNYVPLPWVNNTSGNLQNSCAPNTNNHFWHWTDDNSYLSYQPYLLYILEKICDAVGYSCDFDEIRNSNYKYLLICNALPGAWRAFDFALALPHWSLTEFFEQLELFLFGEFIIDHKAKHIEFIFTTKAINNADVVLVDEVVNEYTAEVSRDEQSDYLGVKNLAYADNDNRLWAYRDCEWYIRENKSKAVVYDHLSDLLTYASTLKYSGYSQIATPYGGYRNSYYRGYPVGSDGHKLFYAKDVDTYFIMFCYKAEEIYQHTVNGVTYHWYKYYNRLEPINQFGKTFVDTEADDIEIRIVPAWIDDTDAEHGPCIFLECGEMDSATQWTEVTENGNSTGSLSGGSGSFTGSAPGPGERPPRTDYYDDEDYNNGALAQGRAGKAIAKGKQDKDDAYFDCIYIGFWDGYILRQGTIPCPIVDRLDVDNDFHSLTTPYSLRLDHASSEINRNLILPIDSKKKYCFSFLMNTIPDPRNIFHISGGRYLCEKLTVTFTEDGRSQMIKGEFYRVVDQ